MLHLILADSELETIPKELSSEKAIRREAERVDKDVTDLILDSNFHHREMDKMGVNGRRGRPDIVHICLLTALDTPLNRENLLRVYVHTRHNKMIEIDPETRIPRSYNRFIGLMEQLFQIEGVPPENPLLKMYDKNLRVKVNEISAQRTITLSEDGKSLGREDLFQNISQNEDTTIIVGGFPSGNFISDIEEFSDEIVSIYPKPLDAVTAINHLIQFYEEENRLI